MEELLTVKEPIVYNQQDVTEVYRDIQDLNVDSQE